MDWSFGSLLNTKSCPHMNSFGLVRSMFAWMALPVPVEESCCCFCVVLCVCGWEWELVECLKGGRVGRQKKERVECLGTLSFGRLVGERRSSSKQVGVGDDGVEVERGRCRWKKGGRRKEERVFYVFMESSSPSSSPPISISSVFLSLAKDSSFSSSQRISSNTGE